MIQQRNLSNLGEKAKALQAFQAVETYFGINYLQSRSDYLLPSLWKRLDRIATIELYILGSCLLSFKDDEGIRWLKKTIRNIKAQKENAKGLFTEIIYHGFLKLKDATIKPAPNKNPGYDFIIQCNAGPIHYISVKNRDLSDEYKKFIRASRKLRKVWQDKLKNINKNLGIRIAAKRYLTTDDITAITDWIKGASFPQSEIRHDWDDDIFIAIHTLPYAAITSSSIKISDNVLICCPSPPSESTRYLSCLREAIKNINKHTSLTKGACRVIFMRMHVHADYDLISHDVKSLVENNSDKIDCIICYQPSYGRNTSNQSLIHHCLKTECSPRYLDINKNLEPLVISPPIGSISVTQHKMELRIDEKIIEVAVNGYIFQQGDIYLDALGEGIHSLESPAMGIRQHLIVHMEDGSFTLSKKSMPIDEELTIV